MKLLSLLAFVLASTLPLPAATIDVTDQILVTVHNGDSIWFHIGIWNYALQADRYGFSSPYPSQVSLSLGGLPPQESGLAPMPDTSGMYYPGFLFAGSLDSLDGSVSVPLEHNGSLLLSPGFRSSPGYTGPVATLTANWLLTPSGAASLFGADALTPWSDGAVIRLRNLGEDLRFGYPNYPIKGALSASLSGHGPVSFGTGAVPGTVQLTTAPEPGTLAMLALGMALLAAARCSGHTTTSFFR